VRPRNLPAPDDGRALLNTTRVYQLIDQLVFHSEWTAVVAPNQNLLVRHVPVSTKAMRSQSELANETHTY